MSKEEQVAQIAYEAKKRLIEEIENGTFEDECYWRGYRDAVQRILRVLEVLK